MLFKLSVLLSMLCLEFGEIRISFEELLLTNPSLVVELLIVFNLFLLTFLSVTDASVLFELS